MNQVITRLWGWHDRFFGLVSYLQSPFLLFVRLYWGWQLAQNGWAKFHHLSNVAEYFGTLGLAMTAQMAVFISCLEFFGGIFLVLGLFSRITGLALPVNLILAFVVVAPTALSSFFPHPHNLISPPP